MFLLENFLCLYKYSLPGKHALVSYVFLMQNQVVANVADRAELIKRLEKAEAQVHCNTHVFFPSHVIILKLIIKFR